MSELSLEAMGYTAAEARVSRRAYDLATPPEQRTKAVTAILARSDVLTWEVLPQVSLPTTQVTTEKAA